jgi:transposase
MQTRIIGIDLAVTASHQAIVLDLARNEYLGKPRSFRTRPRELTRIWQWAQQDAHEPVEVVAICEATGMAWYPVCVYLHRLGAQVFRIHGGKTRDMRQVLQRHAGSDRIDCRALAKLYTVAKERLIPWGLVTGDQLALQRACREACGWREDAVARQNRIVAYDQWAWGGLNRLIPAQAQDWMRQNWYDPWAVQKAGRDALCRAWQAASPQQPATVDWIPGWVARAEEMAELYGSPDLVGYTDLQARMQREVTLRTQAQEAQDELSRTLIRPLYRRLYPDCLLESIKGIGTDSAAIYMAFIQDIARFPSLERFRSWCGMIPGSHQSGGSEAKHMPLTQAGPDPVKATLYLNADVARQWDVQIAALYYRQMVQFGKHHTQAVCACASHLANRIYAVLTRQEPYQLRDLDQQPISVKESRRLCLAHYHVPEEVRQRTRVRARKERAQQRVEQRFQKQGE